MLLGLGLVLLSSVTHAVWNLLVKRSGLTGTPFVWLYSAVLTPVLLLLLLGRVQVAGGIGPYWAAALVSAGLHTLYAVVLQQSYARADLGVVYPVARAGAPVLVALVSVPLLQTRSTPALWVGIALICLGVPLLAGSRGAQVGAAGAVFGVATAAAIAGYTLWDGYAVTHLSVDVLTYLTLGSLAQFAVLTVAVVPERGRLTAVARSHWPLAVAVAALVPLSYGLVLVALQHVDVQVVAATRSAGIVAAAVLGWWLLDEPTSPRRVTGALVLVVGVVVAAFGG